MPVRSQATVDIEQRLIAGESISGIARDTGLSRQRVSQINKRLRRSYCVQDVAPPQQVQAEVIPSDLHMKSLTIKFTPAVFAALTDACQIVNHNNEAEDKMTVEDFVEETVMNKLVDLGLLRKYRKK